MKKYYEVGYHKASIERTSSGYFATDVKDISTGIHYENLFSNEVEALREILSYAEIDEDEFDK